LNRLLPSGRRNRARAYFGAFPVCFLCALSFAGTSLFAQNDAIGSQEPELPATHQASLLQPFWVGKRVSNEPVFFLQAPHEKLATARLLFVPTKLLTICSVDGANTFIESKDFTWEHGTNLLTLTPHSKIPFKTWEEMHPPVGAEHTLGKTQDGKTSLYFIENSPTFQNLQPLVTYEHNSPWQGHIPQSDPIALARTMARLRAKQPIHIVVLGDSISAGAGASSLFHEFPYQPGFVDLVANGLRFRYGSEIFVTNLSEGGQDTGWGAAKTAEVIAVKPDLVVLSFGGNDGSRRFTATEYERNNRTMVTAIQTALPQADIILTATMGANPEWDQSAFSFYPQYLAALNRIKQPGVAVADLTTVWADMLKIKKFDDLTMNGVNHPNDFGQRIYSHVVLQLFQ